MSLKKLLAATAFSAASLVYSPEIRATEFSNYTRGKNLIGYHDPQADGLGFLIGIGIIVGVIGGYAIGLKKGREENSSKKEKFTEIRGKFHRL